MRWARAGDTEGAGDTFPQGKCEAENLRSRFQRMGEAKPRPSGPGSLRSFVPCPSTSARGHPELLLQLEQRHGLLRPHPQVFPRRLRLCRAGPSKAQAQLHASLLDCRVSPSPGMAESGGKWVASEGSRGAHRMRAGNQPCI